MLLFNRILSKLGLGVTVMTRGVRLKILVAVLAAMAAAVVSAQASRGQKPQQTAPAPQPAPQQPAGGNPFPENLSTVPLMSASDGVAAIPREAGANDPNAAPAVDSDPVMSPEDLAPGEAGASGDFSSSRSGIDSLVNAPDDEPAQKKKKGQETLLDIMPKETAEKSIDVGNYYLDRKDWRAALSRFQSALVLAPENPDVYWGLAESQRHMGQFADARKNYQMVVDYDPDSKHGKEARKLLKDPQLANAEPKK